MYKLFSIFLLFSLPLFSQKEIPADYFSNPLEIPLELSGTFGELRNNHFHSGLDIKTQQKEGLPIYAPADGYVSRIKVAHFGYGKALYIQHPNGYTTVYGHLREYAGAIQELVKQSQYKMEAYEIELFPKLVDLPIKKGDLIGYTGNTGGSGGPHLHYEIRDNASRPMNPKLFGVDISDTRKPLINSVFVYPISEDAQVNQDANAMQLRLIPKNDGSYVAEKIIASGTLGFGISTVDQQNAANNRNGVYKIESTFNGEKSVSLIFDKISFDETRYINRFIDYAYFSEKKTKIQKLFIEKNNPLSIYKESKSNGYIRVEDGFNSVYTISVSDFKGNEVLISIPIDGKSLPLLKEKPKIEGTHFVFAKEGATIKQGKFDIYIPPNSLYDDIFLTINADADTLHFHKDTAPIHSNITISVDASNFTSADMDKVFIGKLNYRGQPYYNSTNRVGTILSTRVREFGNYGLAIDTVPPIITPLNFTDGKWISNNKTLEIKIQDTLSGIKSYRATINDKWVLMEYEYKNNLLTYSFENNITTETEFNLKLIVTDNVGNNTKFEATFYRK
ncbi:MAG: peptidase M23 [Bacteroidetes bacterium HGW-Bacteroidetes-2]|jgi:hypothetical protein|nr:MAG: peptidase M23 [Bacteroidetes bacterium HGW-Bacteroidetes-2]